MMKDYIKKIFLFVLTLYFSYPLTPVFSQSQHYFSKKPEETPQRKNIQPKREDSGPTLNREEQRENEEKRISLELKNIDIVEVLKLLSQKGNINIVAGRNVRGRVTLFLKNVLVWDVLKIIFESNQLAYVQEGEILKVMTSKEYEKLYGVKFDDKRKMEVINLKYATADDVAGALKQIKSKIGNIIVDSRVNTLILIDTELCLKKMRDMIAKIDVPIVTKTFSLIYIPAQKIENFAKNIISKNGTLHLDFETNKVVVSDSADNVAALEKLIYEIDKEPFLVTRVFSLNYALAKDIETQIKEELTKDVGTIRVDERTNRMIVTDLPPVINKIKRIVPAFDEKTKEVLIEAKIVQVALNDSFQLGINWERIIEGFKDNNLNFTLTTAFDMITETSISNTAEFQDKISSLAGGRIIGTGTLEGKDQFTAVLNTLKTIGKTNLLSTPRIITINNQEAQIQVGTREAFVTDTVVQSSSTATTAQNVTFIDVGVILSVTPTINNVGYVTMKIKPEISAVSRIITTSGGNVIPIVETQEAETVVMVKDGTTIIIGGLIQDQQIKTTSKMPIIGSIPILGLAFKKTVNKIVKNELAIFLTPRILEGSYNIVKPAKRLTSFIEKTEKDRY
ncbi:secretin N-terminal domain-containing protein [Candidatus Auribacterota bacterium]